MRRFVFLFSIALCAVAFRAAGQARAPKLVVNIVVSQMRYDYLTRFSHNFSEGGFRRMMNDGVFFTNARYGYTGNNTLAGLTTILSGADPSAHGVVAERWIDYTTNEAVYAVADKNYYGLGCVEILGQYAPTHLTASTIGDELKRHNKQSRVISIALEPTSSVIGGGTMADAVYWFDPFRGNWCTSTYYMDRLPNWVDQFNTAKSVNEYNRREWSLYRLPSAYVYSERSEIFSEADRRAVTLSLSRLMRRKENEGYFKMQIMPTGVDLMMDFAKQTIIYESLGKGEQTDLLTITVDPLRFITETYGTEAMETEDALYRLDANLANLIEFVEEQIGKENALFVLTADHGSSDTFRPESRNPRGLFNAMQFKVVINGFLNTQYGDGDWVVDYVNNNLYLNHRLIFERNVNLGQMQAQVAAFALQFRGIAQAVTGTALQSNHFAGGTLQKIQKGYYPKHSGDVIVSLMPGWIEEAENRVSLSGSEYEYDTHVPLLFYGAGLIPQTIREAVDMTDLAPTLARILDVSRPDAATGQEIVPITGQFERKK
ncbi:MAG: alkaline phosphatase family protein [Rikenellaceae bacterium]|jgi:predicted AlkP superfamily pyrophosphatase or phosphodiesterase|nr:alkaline phosphatase family protein [Rikenellaceae bacterium]